MQTELNELITYSTESIECRMKLFKRLCNASLELSALMPSLSPNTWLKVRDVNRDLTRDLGELLKEIKKDIDFLREVERNLKRK